MTTFFINSASWGFEAQTRVTVMPTARSKGRSWRRAAGIVAPRPTSVRTVVLAGPSPAPNDRRVTTASALDGLGHGVHRTRVRVWVNPKTRVGR